MDSNKSKIVITGFGPYRSPFQTYEKNPSWEAVKILDTSQFEQEIVKLEIPVVYEATRLEVERIWNEYDPVLVVHCGVSLIAKGVTLEKRAVINMERYCYPDEEQCTPHCVKLNTNHQGDSLQYLYTHLDVDLICNEINQQCQQGVLSVPAFVSDRAGEYLCEFIYRCSLMKNNRTMFIHVPHITDEMTAQNISDSLVVAIKSAIGQLEALS